MDKNMINIDDLVKQRLSGGEEKERPGAWLQMRELLDKEMPAQAPGSSFNWRRTFGFIAGFLVLASASIGGYKAVTSFRSSANGSATTPTAAVAMNGNPAKTSGKGGNTTTAASTDHNNKANTPANTIPYKKQAVATNTSTNTLNTKQPNHTAVASLNNNVSKHTTESGNVPAVAKNIANNKPSANTGNKNSGNTSNSLKDNNIKGFNGLAANNKQNASSSSTLGGAKQADNVAPTSNNTVATANTTKAGNTAASNVYASGNTAANSKAEVNKPSIQNNTVANNAKQNTTSSNGLSKNDKPANKPANNNTKPSAPANDIAKADKKMIDKIETKETYDRRKGEWKKDTVDKGKVEWSDKDETMVAVKGKKEPQTVNDEIVPASSTTVSSDKNEEKMLPLADFRTSRKNTNYATSNFLETMVKNAKMQFGNIKFYPGVLLGVNYALSNNHGMPGFQFGVTGSLSLNEKWGIVTELKYLNGMNGSRISNRNDYMTNFKTITDPNTNTSTYSWDSVEHYFTYATVQSVQMPFMVRYSTKRVNVLLGANLAYSFIPSPNETSNRYEVKNMPNTNNYRPATGAILDPLDFSSRFGIGYLFGVGYQLSPSMQVDGRITQQVWDNAKTPGAERVSKEVYQAPSLQVNWSYRFSSNKYKPYRQH